MLCGGTAFVAPMEGLLGTRLLRWDFPHLQQHLPAEQKYGVMLGGGSGKIVMSHTARNGQRQVDLEAAEEEQEEPSQQLRADAKGCLSTSDQTRMTFQEFQDQAARFVQSGGKGTRPYFGIHLMWRFKPQDNGYVGEIDQDMQDDLWSINFSLIREWQEANLLPLVQRLYLFAGLGGTVYHCHYDLQPNLHVQLTGRKRFILFPPEEWANLYPFPVHHDLDRRSMIDLDAPDSHRFPNWRKAKGMIVELSPGDALYIPPFWWHHVQSLTPETTSMAMWFFEFYPHSSTTAYGVGTRAADIMLMRDIEELVGKQFPDVAGEEDCTKSRPTKAKQVAAFIRWMSAKLKRGGTADIAANADLTSMSVSCEKLEMLILQMIVERFEEQLSEAQARGKFLDLNEGRFVA